MRVSLPALRFGLSAGSIHLSSHRVGFSHIFFGGLASLFGMTIEKENPSNSASLFNEH
jgi:hypothetical protein